MASLLDGFLGTSMDDPRTMGLLALAGGLVRGDFGGGLQSAGQAISAAQDAQLKRQLIAEDLAMKKLAEQRAQQQFEMQRDALTRWRALQGGGQPSQPEIAPSAGGALGSGTFGIPTGGQQAITPRNNIDAQLSALGEMAMAGVPGAKEQLDILKYRNDPQKVDAGGYTRNPVTGEMTYNVDPTKNIDYNPATKTVTPLNGAVQTQAALSLASEIPKAFVNAASTINLRRGPDNREYPVPAINENPYLGALLQSLGGNAPPQGASAPQTLPAPPLVGVRPATAPQTAPRGMNSTGVLPGEADRAAILNAELQKSQQRLAELQSRQAAGDKAVTPGMIASEQGNISDLTKQLGPNIAAPSASASAGGPPNPVTGYGMSTQETNKAAADKAYAEQAAKDTVEQRKSILAAGDAAPTNIAKYQRIGQLLSDVNGGKFTPAGYEFQSALNSLGVKIGDGQKLGNVQAAQALANELALQLRSPQGGAGMPGALSDKDREFLVSMTPSITQSAQGRTQIIDAYIALQKRNQQVAQFARNYEKKYGRLDNGFFDQLQSWSNTNPLYGAK